MRRWRWRQWRSVQSTIGATLSRHGLGLRGMSEDAVMGAKRRIPDYRLACIGAPAEMDNGPLGPVIHIGAPCRRPSLARLPSARASRWPVQHIARSRGVRVVEFLRAADAF